MKLPQFIQTLFRAATDDGAAPQPAARMPAVYRPVARGLQDLLLLGARLYVAKVFLLSGLTKLRDWDITLALFQDEYKVPLLPPELAAYLGTGGELVLPVLLALGLGGRFAAVGLSVVNVMAVLSLTDIAPAAQVQHQLWGALLLAVAVFGAGRLSLDRWLLNRSV